MADLKNLLQEYQALLELKDELAERTKRNNQEIENMKQAIAQQMVDDDTPQMQVGDYVFSLSDTTMYSKKSEAYLASAGLDFFEVLREQGLGDLIKETVNARTLQSTIRAMVEEQGELPEELADVINAYETLDIKRRKATNKALKKAKKGE